MPHRLLIRMKENSAISQGRNLRKSWPRLSRAIELRTKKYAVSPMNWPLLGHHLPLPGHHQPEDDDQDRGDERLQHVLVQPRQPRHVREQRGQVEVVRTRGVVALAAGLQRQQPHGQQAQRAPSPVGCLRQAQGCRVLDPPEPPDDGVDREGRAEHDAQRQPERGAQQVVGQPAETAVQRDPGDQVGQHPEAGVHPDCVAVHLTPFLLRLATLLHGDGHASSPLRRPGSLDAPHRRVVRRAAHCWSSSTAGETYSVS